ncbi:MAG: hypothetical protein LBU87_04185 [Lactobacillales bacterium]|jgi:predicted esterase|nr:hypothetical protein [Lactobacillales bacterium]
MHKKLMIFIPGVARQCDDPGYEVIRLLADQKGCDLVCFHGPFKTGGGWRFYNRLKEALPQNAEFQKSMPLLFAQIEKEVQNRRLTFSDVLFCGHSQGGFLALYLALKLGAAGGISLCGYWPAELTVNPKWYTQMDLVWVEGGLDTYFEPAAKHSYQILQRAGCRIRHVVNAKTTHEILDKSILDDV